MISKQDKQGNKQRQTSRDKTKNRQTDRQTDKQSKADNIGQTYKQQSNINYKVQKVKVLKM